MKRENNRSSGVIPLNPPYNGSGALIISLDLELLWGIFDKVDYRDKIEYFRTTREVIPQILKLFMKYDIACTWAAVGMLFNENWREWEKNLPVITPDYSNKALSAYRYGRSIASPETEDLCFSPDLINVIHRTPRQEIGTHTYSHYYCLEPGQGIKAFEADLQKTVELANNFKIRIESLVFPRNQFNEEYLEVCKDVGITSVRTNPSSWYWRGVQKDSLPQKIFRTGDAYIGTQNKSYSIDEVVAVSNGIYLQKASRLFRPYSGKRIFEAFKMQRIKDEMTKAAKEGEIYHLWWHPHNFGTHSSENLAQLEEILKHYKTCQKSFNFNSINMAELTHFLDAKR